MLSKRIIACLDVRDGRVVKGVNFEGLREAGDPGELARRYNVEGIDEIVILRDECRWQRNWSSVEAEWPLLSA